MKIAVPTEAGQGERRVALVPESIGRLISAGSSVEVERGAGEAAGLDDAAYEAAGATIVADRRALLSKADLVLTVRPLPDADVDALSEGAAQIGMLRPLTSPDHMRRLAARGVPRYRSSIAATAWSASSRGTPWNVRCNVRRRRTRRRRSRTR
jgi:NAD(P) transhydrogenase subunit alpha